jgi:hypothetical protein
MEKGRGGRGSIARGNGRALTGSKGPSLMGRMNLKTTSLSGTNRPVQLESQAVNWATAGLLAGPLVTQGLVAGVLAIRGCCCCWVV